MNKFLLFLLLVAVLKMNAQVSIKPVSPQCEGGYYIQLEGTPGGGVWAGAGITDVNTGEFLPSLAGVGVTKVKYTYNGVTDSINISVVSAANVDFGNVDLCHKSSVVIEAPSGFVSYVWTEGIPGAPEIGYTHQLTVYNSGYFKLVYSDSNGCIDSADVVVANSSSPIVNLGVDKIFCNGDSVLLDVGVFNAISWSTGSSSSYIKTNQAGVYWVDVTDTNGCSDSDTINVLFHQCDNIFKIKGKAYNDLNQNGTQDIGELGLKNIPIYAQTANYYSMTTSDAFGNYSVNTFETGTATVNIQLPNNSQLISPSSPAYHSISISAMNDSVLGKDFAIHFLPDVHDVKVDLSTNLARPGFQTICNAYVYNKGTATEKNISLDLAYDNLLTPSTSSIPYSNTNNILTFTIDSIKAGESKLVSVAFNVAQGANHLGHQLDYFGDVSLATNDVYLSDNKDTCFRIITGSYDPNMKESTLGEGNISTSTKEMEYTIHFQNTGTDTAFTVVVKDSLNKSVFDYKEVEMLSASHKYSYSIDTAGVIAFTFNNILLVDSTTNEPASHGFVKFKVKLNQGLGLGTVLKNKGYIYFDFNAPIITNEATNTLSNSVGVNEVSNLNFKVFPNPSNDKITLMGSSASLYSVEMYDVLGKRVYAQSNIQNAHVVNVSSFEKGIYFVRISQDGKQEVVKVVVQ